MNISKGILLVDHSEVDKDAILDVDYYPIYVRRDSWFNCNREIRSIVCVNYKKDIGKRPMVLSEEVLNDIFIYYKPRLNFMKLCDYRIIFGDVVKYSFIVNDVILG